MDSGKGQTDGKKRCTPFGGFDHSTGLLLSHPFIGLSGRRPRKPPRFGPISGPTLDSGTLEKGVDNQRVGMLFSNDQDQAGPSTRPYGVATFPTSAPTVIAQCELGVQCPLRSSHAPLPIFGDKHTYSSGPAGAGQGRKRKRQDRGTDSAASTMSSTTSMSSSETSSSSSDGLFVGPSLASNSSGSPTVSSSATHRPYYQSSVTSIISTRSFTAPWTRTSSARPQSTYVSGLMLNLTLAGNSDSEAVYSVPMTFGHGIQNGSDSVLASRWRRDSSTDPGLNGANFQVVNLQVDLGSSDMVSNDSYRRSSTD